jgi:NTE family protein
MQTLKEEADIKVCNVVHLICRCMTYESGAKDFEFSRRTMEEHWRARYNDAISALGHREVLGLPDRIAGVRTFDFARSD